MTISELIVDLQYLKCEHGDIEVTFAGCNCPLNLVIVDDENGKADMLVIIPDKE